MTNYILPHLGLGDYILCNGLIRNLIKSEGEYILFCNNKMIESITFMFRDLKNLSYSYIPPVEFNGKYILPYITKHPYHIDIIGYEYLDKSTTFGKSCYKQFGLNFEKRWTDFYVERDINKELELFNSLEITENNYIFIHEDPARNQLVNRKYIEHPDLEIINVKDRLSNNIFDYLYIIEHAAEIHVIESSFFLLIDTIKTNGKLFAHEYARPLYDYTRADVKKDWNILR